MYAVQIFLRNLIAFLSHEDNKLAHGIMMFDTSEQEVATLLCFLVRNVHERG